MNLLKNKKIMIPVALFIFLLGSLFTAYKIKEHDVKQKLINLGYSTEEVSKMISLNNLFSVVNQETDHLNQRYQGLTTDIETKIGYTLETIDLSPYPNMIAKINFLQTYADEQIQLFTNDINDLKVHAGDKSIDVSDIAESLSLIEQKNHLSHRIVGHYEGIARALEATDEQILTTSRDHWYEQVVAYESLINELEIIKANKNFTYDRDGAMRLFQAVNDYRASQGLAPYSYNGGLQSCVDDEAVGYATNLNPHNWYCRAAANENAALASVNSNYVQVAMDFFITDPPHHAILVAPQNSAAVSIVFKNGVAYMILDIFN